MEKEKVVKILKDIRNKKLSVDDAVEKLRHLPFEDLGFAKVDHHRTIRTGFPEVIFCSGKKEEQITAIFKSLSANAKTVLLTKAGAAIYRKIKKIDKNAVYNKLSGTIYVQNKKKNPVGKISVICAGTADTPFAEEAAITAEVFGAKVERVYDVGVAGLHRLFAAFDRIKDSRSIVVLAGMDGALPSVIGGLVACPVIAVPTSIGYGSNLGGIAPLLTMLNSCASNVSVVNINNGFGAGYIASIINRMGT